MREGNFFNGVVYHRGDNLFDVLNKSHGFGKISVNNLILRLEVKKISDALFINELRTKISINYLNLLMPLKGVISRRLLINIYVLDLLWLYRGWRHSRNLPVRGQRTWSNGKTATKRNNALKALKLKKARIYYGNLPEFELYTAVLAEQMNHLWKTQWFDEWLAAKQSRSKSKTHKNVQKVDLYSMSRGNVMSPTKFNKLSKKQKQAHNQNHFSLGFDSGFTKSLLKEIYDLKGAGKKPGKFGAAILYKMDPSSRKRNQRKKVDLKVKKAAHVAKKKQKKTAWD